MKTPYDVSDLVDSNGNLNEGVEFLHETPKPKKILKDEKKEKPNGKSNANSPS
jgi:hypothetical protein